MNLYTGSQASCSGVKMEESIEVLAHDASLSPLDAHFFSGKWSKQECCNGEVEGRPAHDGRNQPRASMFREVILSNVKQVC